MAIRDVALSLNAMNLVDKLHEFIFIDKEAADTWIKQTIESLKKSEVQWDQVHKEGEQLEFSKLIPSYVDRKPYFEMLTLGPIKHEIDSI